MNKLYDLSAAFPLVTTLYGAEPNSREFEDIALNGWELIGNKHTRLYRYICKTENKELALPCNVDIIESVSIPIADAQITSNKTNFWDPSSALIENYIDLWEGMDDPFNQKGKLIKYKEGDNVLYFTRDYPTVIVVYQGILVNDETGLPLINEREMKAIAAYVAYIDCYKDGLQKRDRNILAIAQMLKEDWLRRCNAARIPDHLTQNDMNNILDVKVRWDRKQYGKSLKPII